MLSGVSDMRDKQIVIDREVFDYADVIGPYGLAVYLSLCARADKKWVAVVSVKEIADELGISISSVKRALVRLEQCKIIIRVRIGRNDSNRYILTDKVYWRANNG